MSVLLEELENRSRLLSQQEKAILARTLIDELDESTDDAVEQIWNEEAQRRYDAYQNGEIDALAGDEVMSRIRARLK
jgi:putative addiction module component (TIGR02574 family)